jgi:uncharacterized protein YndB with AHSA1/START domain
MISRKGPSPMRTFQSHVFSFATEASPLGVWTALTHDEARYLHGMDIASSWQPNAGIRIGGTRGAGLAGTILYVSKPDRVTFSIDDPSGEVTYLTWTIRPTAPGSIVHLFVDEFGDEDDDKGDDEYEDLWLPVLDGLQHQLRDAQAMPGCEP